MVKLHKAINFIGFIGILSTVLLLSSNVVSRKFGWPIPGTYALVTVAAVFVVAPAIIHAQYEGGHIVIDTLRSKFSDNMVKILDLFADVCSIGIWGFAAWVGLQHAGKMWAAREVLDPRWIPVPPFRYIWAISLLLFCFVILANQIIRIKTERQALRRCRQSLSQSL